jgi:hypothetical protein
LKGEDSLSNWLASIKNIEFVDHRSSTIIGHYTDILNYIQTCQLYKIEALNNWSSNATADPWLIATALAHSYTVITFEKSNVNLSMNNPSKDAKIPDICKRFNIKCENLYYMMRQLGFTEKTPRK